MARADPERTGKAPRSPKAPRKRNAPSGKKERPSASRTVQGPSIPGAQKKPTLEAERPLHEVKRPHYRRPKGTGPAKDDVEKAERYVRGTQGNFSEGAKKVLMVREMKRLLEPIAPSLLQVQSDIAHDRKVHPAIRLDAADRLLNRLYGKPTEKVEISDPADNEANPDEVKMLLNRILESVGAPQLEFHDGPGLPQAEDDGTESEA